MKRIIALLLTLVSVMALPVGVFAEDDASDFLWWAEEEIQEETVAPMSEDTDLNTLDLRTPCGFTEEQLEKALRHKLKGYAWAYLKAEKEYDDYPYRPRSLRDMAVSNPSCVVDLPFSKFSYPNMLDGTMAVFAEAFCQSVPGYEYHRGEVYVEYTRPATIGVSGLTETSTGYTAKYSETKENKLSKRVDYYGVILPSVQKVKAEAPPPSPKPKNQW